jgi:hypothetical protein
MDPKTPIPNTIAVTNIVTVLDASFANGERTARYLLCPKVLQSKSLKGDTLITTSEKRSASGHG